MHKSLFHSSFSVCFQSNEFVVFMWQFPQHSDSFLRCALLIQHENFVVTTWMYSVENEILQYLQTMPKISSGGDGVLLHVRLYSCMCVMSTLHAPPICTYDVYMAAFLWAIRLCVCCYQVAKSHRKRHIVVANTSENKENQ